MEYFFLGLGNPRGYEGTRHNVGKDFLEGLVYQSESEWRHTEHGRVACVLIAKHVITCAVGDGFMNSTGGDMYELIDEIDPSRLVLVHDDVDFPVGVVRLSKGKSAGGHNGVESVIQALKTNEFFRLRIGVGKQDGSRPQNMQEYVLGQIPPEEMRSITGALSASLPHIFSELFNDRIDSGIRGIYPMRCPV